MSNQCSLLHGGSLFAAATVLQLAHSRCVLEKIARLKRCSLGYEKQSNLLPPPHNPNIHTSDPTACVDIIVETNGAGSLQPVTTIDLFRETVEKNGDRIALCLKRKVNGVIPSEWKTWTFKEYWEQSAAFGRSLIKMGIQQHDIINIIGFNAPEWFIANNGAMMSGSIPAGIYITNSASSCHYVSGHSKAKLVVVDSNEQLRKYCSLTHEQAKNLSNLKALVLWGNEPIAADVKQNCVFNILTWDAFMAIGSDVTMDDLEGRIALIKPGHCVSLIYTSGTTGAPKAVMLSHDNITWECKIFATEYVKDGMIPGRLVSYLPLSHVAAQMIDIHYGYYSATTAYFAQTDALKGSLSQTLVEVRPTVFFGVPRVWEKMEEKLKEMGRSSTGVKKLIADWAKGLGSAHNEMAQYKRVEPSEDMTFTSTKPWGYNLAYHLVLKKIKEALGLDKCNAFYTAAAPISVDTLKYFASLDIPGVKSSHFYHIKYVYTKMFPFIYVVYELFGQSECTGPHTSSRCDSWKIGYCGRPLPGTYTKITENQELCYKGRHIFMGYMYMPKETEAIFDEEGYMHSGDVAEFDDDEDESKPKPSGFMKITGRIKELIITAGGENIPPTLIEEQVLTLMPAISTCVVIGDRKKFLTMLVCLKTDVDASTGLPSDKLSSNALYVGETIGSKAVTLTEARNDPLWKKYVEDGLKIVNQRATSRAQHVQKWCFLTRDLSESGGELTPTLKLKRSVVTNVHQELIDSMYA